jgi:hypothetical protein
MARGAPGRMWEIKETGKIAFSYNSEQVPEIIAKNKLVVYVTEITQLSLFEDLPPKEQCRKVLKDITTLKLIGFLD